MFAKSAFVVRSLFVAAVLGSLVACTFENPSSTGEENGNTSSALDGKKTGKKSSADASASDSDASFEDNDGGCWKCDQDGGPSDVDGGPYDSDGGVYGNDAGWEGDDDDDSDGGAYDDRDAGF